MHKLPLVLGLALVACKGEAPRAAADAVAEPPRQDAVATTSAADAATTPTKASVAEDASAAADAALDDTATRTVVPARIRLLEPGAEPRAALRYDLKAGQQENAELEMAIELELGATGQRMPSELPKTRMTLAAKVTARDPGGDARFELSVSEADLAAGEELGQTRAAEKLVSVIRSMRGLAGNKTIDTRGITREFSLSFPDGRDASEDVAAARPAVQGFVRAIDHMTVPLPDEPIGVGGKWEVVDQVSEAGMQLEQTRTFEVVSKKDDRLSLRFTVALAPPQGELELSSVGGMKARVKSLAGSGEGTLDLDLTRALPARLDGKNRIDMTVDFEGADGQRRALDVAMRLSLASRSR